VKPWHFQVAIYIAVAAAMCALIFRLPIVFFFVAGFVVLACTIGDWALRRQRKRPGAPR
jgi:hypothetical protein